MDKVIQKTKMLIQVLDSSNIIKNLDYYKNKIITNKEIMTLIENYNNSNDYYEKISLKEKIYKYEEYNLYMKYYNELFYYILKINNKFKKYIVGRGCNNESH